MRSGWVCETVAEQRSGKHRDRENTQRSRDRVRWPRRSVAGIAVALVVPVRGRGDRSRCARLGGLRPGRIRLLGRFRDGPIKTRIFGAADGNTRRVVYALDGLRARNDLSGWEIDTDISRVLPQWNINVAMPVGGQSSFYSDWNAPSNTNGQQSPYPWEIFLTDNLPWAMRDGLGFNPNGNGVFGCPWVAAPRSRWLPTDRTNSGMPVRIRAT